MNIEVKTPGKLYLAGEYAILTPGQAAIIKNIPFYMTAQIGQSETIRIYSDLFDYAVDLTPDVNYALIQGAIAVFCDYLAIQKKQLLPFSLSITGKMEKEGKKLGLGSSGSVVVLTLKSLAAYHQLSLEKDVLFKLASITLLKNGDNGSMGDVACISYDDLIYYQSFDRAAVVAWLAEFDLESVLSQNWAYVIKPIVSRLAFDFLVGWTKQPAISKEMVNRVTSVITPSFLSQTQVAVEQIYEALLCGNKALFMTAMTRVSRLLQDLDAAIYTKGLLSLQISQEGLDVVSKSSGAGGGDCGIAFSFQRRDSQCLIKRWQASGIELIYYQKGVEHD